MKGSYNGIYPIKIRYWRTKSKTEVNFIIEDSGKLIPIEVKYKNSLKKSDFKGLHNFHRNYPNSEKGYLISKSIQQEIDDFKISTPFLIKTFCIPDFYLNRHLFITTIRRSSYVILILFDGNST
ncbi:MAG: DUF4143 domain-containing protein [Spirochaetes bacterium]|nr:DUF4143 domain-containing protein [Spirochaetota bacterium]